MDQQVGNEEDRIIGIFADIQFDGGAVLFHDDAVNSQGHGDPLIFFDTAVVVGVQISKAAVFIERVLLDIKTRGIDVGPQDIETLTQFLTADGEHDDRFIHLDGVDLIAGLQRRALRDHGAELAKAFLFNQIDDIIDAFALGFGLAEEILIILGKSEGGIDFL